jgi:hypothetical protein
MLWVCGSDWGESNKAKQTINNVKDNFNQHKMIYAGLGGILGLALILMNIKKK